MTQAGTTVVASQEPANTDISRCALVTRALSDTVCGTRGDPGQTKSPTLVDARRRTAHTRPVWLLWAAGVAALVFLTFGPMFDAPRRGDSAWTWIFGGLLLGPLAGIAYYASRRGIRMAARRNGDLGRHRLAR